MSSRPFPFEDRRRLQDTALGEKLAAIADLDLAELEAIDLPRGFGRD